MKTLLSCLMGAALTTGALAATISVDFPEINSQYVDTGFPLPPFDWDTQIFPLPVGAQIVSATFDGTFGSTSLFAGSSAHHALLVDGDQYISTADVSPDPYFGAFPVPASWTFSVTKPNIAGSLDYLLDGSATLSVVQRASTSFARVRPG